MNSRIEFGLRPKLLLVGNRCSLNYSLYRRYVCAGYDVSWHHMEPRHESINHFLSEVEANLAQRCPDQMVVSPAPVMARADRFRVPSITLESHLLVPALTIHAAFTAGVQRLLFVGSYEIYPGGNTLPNAEEDVRLPRNIRPGSELATGHLACVQMCSAFADQHCAQGLDYRSVVLPDVFGPADQFDIESGDVIVALIDRMHRAKVLGHDLVIFLGDGARRRDWLFAGDAAGAAIQAQCIVRDAYRRHTQPGLRHLCASSGRCISLTELAESIARAVGYDGRVIIQPAVTAGSPDHQADDARLRSSGWRPVVSLESALQQTYECYLTSKLAEAVC